MAADIRVYPPKELESFLTRATEPLDSPGSVQLFETKQKAMMFAAALGWQNRERSQLNKRGTGIRFDIFENGSDDFFISILAVADAGDLNVLSADAVKERIKAFEEYAHAGLLRMRRECFEKDGDPLVALTNLCVSGFGANDESESELDGIWKELTGSAL